MSSFLLASFGSSGQFVFEFIYLFIFSGFLVLFKEIRRILLFS